MTCTDSQQFWIDRLNALRALLIEYETARQQLMLNTVQSYTINTGQTTQTVTRANLYSMVLAMDSLYNQIVTLEARLGCPGATTYVRPEF